MEKDTATIEPISEKPHAVGTGVQRLYRFDNGYGASVVQFMLPGYSGLDPMAGSYGADAELAVIQWTGANFHLTYETPITEDVIGWLDLLEVHDYLRQIRDLPAAASS